MRLKGAQQRAVPLFQSWLELVLAEILFGQSGFWVYQSGSAQRARDVAANVFLL